MYTYVDGGARYRSASGPRRTPEPSTPRAPSPSTRPPPKARSPRTTPPRRGDRRSPARRGSVALFAEEAFELFGELVAGAELDLAVVGALAGVGVDVALELADQLLVLGAVGDERR